MKFSLFLICFSSLEAKHSCYTVPEDKPLMYFNGREWRERKPDRYSTSTGNQSTFELIDFNTFETLNTVTILNNTIFGDYDIYKRASDKKSDELKQDSTENNVIESENNDEIESETNIILNQILDFIETRHHNTKDTYATASLSTNPEAWIKLILELSYALKEMAVRANESYYMLIKEPTPNYSIETWRRENEVLDGSVGLFSEQANEFSDGEPIEEFDRKNEIYINKKFPLKYNLRKNLKAVTDQGAKEKGNEYMYVDNDSEDVVSDGIEEVRIVKKK